ncbi:MAG: NAD(P)-dependent oxidoreductase [Actinomycetota bacterium]
MRIAFVGIGRMGWHLAGHLAATGHDLAVYDIDADLAARWAAEHAGRAADSVADAVAGCDAVCSSVPADPQLRAVWDAGRDALAPGAVWIDHSTTSAEIARTLAAEAAERGCAFVDAPVSGGTVGAENGKLAVMAGGEAAAWATAERVVSAYAARATLIGPAGAGQLTKMPNQICVLGVGQALAEGLAFAERAGLDPHRVLEVMLTGSSTSWMMENRAALMIDARYDYGFSTTLMRKDVGLVLEEAERMGAELPVTETVARLLDENDARGHADDDWCSLMERQRAASRG